MSQMADLEKSLIGVQPPPAGAVLNGIDLTAPAASNAIPSKAEAEAEAEATRHNEPSKEKKGSIKDYFVSGDYGNQPIV